MTITEIQRKTKFVRTPKGKIAEVILPYNVYQELLELKARLDANEQADASADAPNAETRQAMYDAEHGVNLVVCDNASDLFRKLGI